MENCDARQVGDKAKTSKKIKGLSEQSVVTDRSIQQKCISNGADKEGLFLFLLSTTTYIRTLCLSFKIRFCNGDAHLTPATTYAPMMAASHFKLRGLCLPK